MEATRPDLPAIKRLLGNFVGKKVWGVKLSVAWLSIELGSAWVDLIERVERGEGTLLISCSWKLDVPGKQRITSKMEQTQQWCRSTETSLEGKTLIDHSLSEITHELALKFKDGTELCVTPRGKSSLDEWTLFFRVSKDQRSLVTFNGSTISYDDY